jgi:RNA:NAD 2'-phosphotransferase (TPT1/KptA family)
MDQSKVVDTITDKHYKRVEKLTVELAKEYNVKGYEFQAIVWIAAREGWTYED